MSMNKRMRDIFKSLFHKRNIIVMSERSTAHVSMSARSQIGILLAFVLVIGTASFSTGKYMAAKSVISEQGETIKSVANSRIETNFGYAVPSLGADNNGPTASFQAPLTDPTYKFSTMDEGKLVSHIAFLENRIQELNKTNQDIIKVVRKTADGQIRDLEKVIQQTGLSPRTLKRHAKQEKKIQQRTAASKEKAEAGGQGGPFIPDYWDEDMRQFAEDLEHSTNELFVLKQIFNMLPTAKPMSSSARFSSSFGHRRDPFSGRLAFHSGLDLASKTKPQIIASADGIVSIAERRGSYGNLVEVKHGLGISTRYAHLSRIFVTPGARVKKGQVIGMQGSTGRSTGAHLHYEVRFNNRPINPRGFINAGKSYVSEK